MPLGWHSWKASTNDVENVAVCLYRAGIQGWMPTVTVEVCRVLSILMGSIHGRFSFKVTKVCRVPCLGSPMGDGTHAWLSIGCRDVSHAVHGMAHIDGLQQGLLRVMRGVHGMAVSAALRTS